MQVRKKVTTNESQDIASLPYIFQKSILEIYDQEINNVPINNVFELTDQR